MAGPFATVRQASIRQSVRADAVSADDTVACRSAWFAVDDVVLAGCGRRRGAAIVSENPVVDLLG